MRMKKGIARICSVLLLTLGFCTLAPAVSNAALLEGDNGQDCISGTNNADTIRGFGGVDALHGQGGADTISGGDGSDYATYCTISQDPGGGIGLGPYSPRLYGGDGNDTIYGGDGGDMLLGQGGSDDLYGNEGNDIIYANGDSTMDEVYGNGGNDDCWVTVADQVSGCEDVHVTAPNP